MSNNGLSDAARVLIDECVAAGLFQSANDTKAIEAFDRYLTARLSELLVAAVRELDRKKPLEEIIR